MSTNLNYYYYYLALLHGFGIFSLLLFEVIPMLSRTGIFFQHYLALITVQSPDIGLSSVNPCFLSHESNWWVKQRTFSFRIEDFISWRPWINQLISEVLTAQQVPEAYVNILENSLKFYRNLIFVICLVSWML